MMIVKEEFQSIEVFGPVATIRRFGGEVQTRRVADAGEGATNGVFERVRVDVDVVAGAEFQVVGEVDGYLTVATADDLAAGSGDGFDGGTS